MLTNRIYSGWWVIDERREPGPTPIKSNGRRKDRRKVKRAPEEIHRHQVFRPLGSPPDPPDRLGGAREEAIVSEDTFAAVQVIVEAKSTDYYKPREPRGDTRFVYTSVLWCAECGQRMWSRTRPGEVQDSSRRDWYACASTQRTSLPRCSTKYIARKKLDAAMGRLFSVILSDERFLRGVIEHGSSEQRNTFAAQIEAVTTERLRVVGRRSKLLDLYLDDGIPRHELDARRLDLDKHVDRLDRELSRLQRSREAADRSHVMDGLREALVALQEFEFWSRKQRRDFLLKFFPRIDVSSRGVERVHLQVPSARRDGASTVTVERDLPLVLIVGMTWEQLKPPVVITEFGLPEREFYTRRDLKTVLGWSEWMLQDRLAKGLIPEPSARHWGKRAWTAAEVRAAVTRVKEAQSGGPAGLPMKPFYTSTDVANLLGLTWEQLRYAIELGRVPDCRERDAQGHRVWTREEVERAVTESAKSTDSPEIVSMP
jgi:DNA-binding transcriptional MerR regulator